MKKDEGIKNGNSTLSAIPYGVLIGVAFLAFLLLGSSMMKKRTEEITAQFTAQIETLNADYDELRQANLKLEEENAALREEVAQLEAELTVWNAIKNLPILGDTAEIVAEAQVSKNSTADEVARRDDAELAENNNQPLISDETKQNIKDAANSAGQIFVEKSNQFGQFAGDQLGEYVEGHPDSAVSKAMNGLVDWTEGQLTKYGITP